MRRGPVVGSIERDDDAGDSQEPRRRQHRGGAEGPPSASVGLPRVRRAEGCRPAAGRGAPAHRLRACGRREPRGASGRHAARALRARDRPRPAGWDLRGGAQRGVRRLAPAGPGHRGRACARLARPPARRCLSRERPRPDLGAPQASGTTSSPTAGCAGCIRRHLQLERLEEAQIPLHVGTFDVLGGQEVRLSEGPAIDAVLASSAIPGMLPPVTFGDRLLVDGGVVRNAPISHAVELGAERIYVLPTIQGDSRALPVVRAGRARPRSSTD